jgi:small-conductance mechanosensitive channel
MLEMFKLQNASDWLIGTSDWLAENLLNRWSLLQILLLIAVALVTRLVAPRLLSLVKLGVARIKAPKRLQPVVAVGLEVFQLLIFIILLWLVVGVMRELTWPSRIYWVGVLASLMTAWVVRRLLSATIARFLAVCVWSVAALAITGLLDPTIEVLDRFALSLGDLRISVLTVVKGFVSLALLLWVASSVSRLLEIRINKLQELTPSIQVLLSKLLKITLLTFAVIVAMNSIGIDLTGLALFSGAIGLGIGFGLQKVVSNLISGVILLLDKSIKPGDVIELGETFGWISSLGARYVSVVTRDGKEYLIPNEDLITQRVVNWSFSTEFVRQEVQIGVSYNSDPHRVREILVDAARTPSRVAENPGPVCHLVGFGDSSLDFVLRFWIRDPRNGVANVRGEVLLAVWDALKENSIEIPYPHRQIIMTAPASFQGADKSAA